MKQFFSVLFLIFIFAGISIAQIATTIDKGAEFKVNPKPDNITPSAMLTPIEEVFGLNQNLFAGGINRARGNFFTCTTSRRVVEQRLYLNPTSATNLYFCIYECDTQVGDYNQISAVLVTGQGPGEGWYSSGAIDVTLTAGKYYVIYTQMDAQTAYWTQNPVSPFPVPCSFGEQTGGAGWATGSVPIYGSPPPATQTFAATAFVDPVAYYQTIVTDDIGGGGTAFTDNFDSYIAGQMLACQNPVDWSTWSNAPCGSEDAFISTNYSNSAPNSTVIAPNNDLIKLLGDQTSGIWYIEMDVYIPAGKSGYFNTLSDFTFVTGGYWAMECYFDLGGAGRLLATTTTAFTWTPATWQHIRLMVDLDLDQAQFWIDGTLVNSWTWTLGASGGTGPLVIAANDFFGATANDQMYFDNYYFGDTPTPVELTSFTAISNHGIVELNWETATEINNQGFEIERRTVSSEFRTVGFVEGAGTVTETRNYSYDDKTADQGINYYRLKQIDFDGTFAYSDEVEVDVTAPLSFDLAQNYPNPFNPSTSIQFSVPESGNVKLSVYNLVGEEVAVLVNGFNQAGTFEVTFDASNLSTGVYLYKLQSANSVQTKKMMLLK